jgi:hypothetical protein
MLRLYDSVIAGAGMRKEKSAFSAGKQLGGLLRSERVLLVDMLQQDQDGIWRDI